MPSRRSNVADLADRIISSYLEFPFYTRALTVHRTHRDLRMSIPEGSYLEGLYKDKSRHIIVMKSTQSGISEYLIVRSFYRAEVGRSVFYVLPTFDLKNQFVKERIDKAMLYSQHYRSVVLDSERKFSESMSMKQIGRGVIAFVGSNTANAFISFAADDVVIDEYDRCNKDNIIMAPERQAASLDRTTVEISNPTVLNFGIDYKYNKSDAKVWEVRGECGHWVEPDFFKHVVREVDKGKYVIRDESYDRFSGKDISLVCECGKPFNRYGHGRWTATQRGEHSGYHISKLFSSTVTVKELVESFEEGLLNPSKLQRFYNADLGLAFNAAGSKVTRDMLDECVDLEYLMPDSSQAPCVMGVDVGEFLHVRIDELLPDGRQRAVYIGAVREYEDVQELHKKFNVKCFVVDALPESRLSKKLVATLRGGFMCFYGTVKGDVLMPRNRVVTVERTGALDAVKEAYMTGSKILPANASNIPEFYEQMEASTRVFNEEKQRYEWVEVGGDHFFHAESYLQLARRLLISLSKR